MKRYKLLIIGLMLVNASLFAQNMSTEQIPYRKGPLWGYASPDRTITVTPIYEETNFFSEGFAAVKKGGKYGYINRMGQVAIPFNYYVAKPFRQGYFDNPAKRKTDTVLFAGASLRADGYEICINTKGVRMPQCPAINENTVSDGKQADTIPMKSYALVKANGDLYDKIIDDYAIGDNKYYISTKNGKYGVFNNVFEVVIPYEYGQMKRLPVNNGIYLHVEKNGLQGLLNGDGTVYLPVENNEVSLFKPAGGTECLVISKNGRSALKDMKLNDLAAGVFNKIEYDKEGGFVLTDASDLKGYYFTVTGKEVRPAYKSVRSVNGGRFIYVTNESRRSGYIDNNAREFFDD